MTFSKLDDAFDIELFRTEGKNMIDQLAGQMKAAMDMELPVLKLTSPEEELKFWSDYQWQDQSNFFETVFERSIRLHHPRYIGHQVSVPVPSTALAGLFSDLYNNGMGIYEMGSAATAMERVIIKEMASKLGFDDLADGFLTSGGTLANLTCLLAARATQQMEDENPVILVSDQAHYCIERAAITMGLGKKSVIQIKSDKDFKMSIDDLFDAFKSIKAQGRKILCVVACSCSTGTGSYDDLNAIGSFCESEGLWFHVDGAHGGAAAFSSKYWARTEGIFRADSVVIDLHKMMLTPALATAVLFKKGQDSYRSFGHKASYIFEQEENEWYNLAKRTYETTKYMMSIKFFLLIKKYGWDIIDEFVSQQYDLALDMASYIDAQEDFEIAHRPESNIICFRFVPESGSVEEANRMNRLLRKMVIEEGKFYIVQAELNGILYLRLTVMNPLTELAHLMELLSHLRDLNHQITHD